MKRIWYAPLMALFAIGTAQAVPSEFCDTAANAATTLPNPIVFATQVPVPTDFATIGSVFANHQSGLGSVARGGDLMILYPNRQLCNLTRAAGLGESGVGQNGPNAIAVRDPDVHFDGQRVLFSMVVGGAPRQFERPSVFWQIFEVTGLSIGQPVSVTRLAGQPVDANNVMPIYAPDGSIIFVSDRPHNGQPHLYPPLDEYESTPTPSGLWKLAADGSIKLMQHSPSGSFDPLIDSYGRVVFTRWDHLLRDQQGDSPTAAARTGAVDYSSEAANATSTTNVSEVFPEPRAVAALVEGTRFNGVRLNHFFPWMINLDGTEEETLNHVGRHELHRFFSRAFNDDDSLVDFNGQGRVNPNSILNFLQIVEDPSQPGRYVGVEAPEFDTHGSGMLIALEASPEINPDDMEIQYLTHPDTGNVDTTPSPNHSGFYRNPAVLSNGELIASHAPSTLGVGNLGTPTNIDPRHDFQLKSLAAAGNGFMAAQQSLTGGINRQVTYFNPDQSVSFNGPLWELYAVEVRTRALPEIVVEPDLAQPERTVFDRVGVDESAFRDFLRRENLALMVARDVTTRDDLDRQQPFNLRVPGGVERTGDDGAVYDIPYFQFIQGDMIRGYNRSGRRVLSRFMHDSTVLQTNPPDSVPVPGAVRVFPDGSVASFVPVQRAMAWQSTAEDGEAVVRERVWVTFQAGEIRVCDGCHGVNKVNQMGQPAALNEPQALEALLAYYRDVLDDVLLRSSFEGRESR